MAQGILGSQIAAAQASMTIKVKRTGRVRPPKLDDPQLAAIGQKMVAEQKARWGKNTNAAGVTAKKLSVRYAIIKQAVLHKRAVRDMILTGRTVNNFQLRKAALGVIRAENTTLLQRDCARRANGYDQMIGFALTDIKVSMDAMQVEWGQWVGKAWIPVGGTAGGEMVAAKSTYSTGGAANQRFAPTGGRTRRPSTWRK